MRQCGVDINTLRKTTTLFFVKLHFSHTRRVVILPFQWDSGERVPSTGSQRGVNPRLYKEKRKIHCNFLLLLFIWDYLCWFLSYAAWGSSEQNSPFTKQGGMIETSNIKALLWKKSRKTCSFRSIDSYKQNKGINTISCLFYFRKLPETWGRISSHNKKFSRGRKCDWKGLNQAE